MATGSWSPLAAGRPARHPASPRATSQPVPMPSSTSSTAFAVSAMPRSRCRQAGAIVAVLALAVALAAPLAAAKDKPPNVGHGQATVDKSCDIPSLADPLGAVGDACDAVSGAVPDVP